MNNNTIYVEKIESKPGIYVICNVENKKLYIGKSNNLKRRFVEHITYLFKGRDNNPKLQAEFNKNENKYRFGLLENVDECRLDIEEGNYFNVAVKMFSRQNVYNKIDLNNNDEVENKKYIENIQNFIKRMENDTINVKVIKNIEDIKQDWLISAEIINSEVIDYYNSFADDDKKLDSSEECLSEISLKQKYENDLLDFMFLGKMGDYVEGQTFTDIIIEKIADILYYGKCLWITSGPDIENFNHYRKLYGTEKKIFVLFSLTPHKYKEGKTEDEPVYYCWKENENVSTLYDVGPIKKSKKQKALVINNFWVVSEDFDRDNFFDLFYQAMCESNNGKNVLTKNPNEAKRSTLLSVFSNKIIIERKDIQEDLNLIGDLYDQFMNERNKVEFPKVTDKDVPRYILAEVSDYVEVSSDYNKDDIEFIRYKEAPHPYYMKKGKKKI